MEKKYCFCYEVFILLSLKVITVALRCPDGTVKKRRFTVDSQIKVL